MMSSTLNIPRFGCYKLKYKDKLYQLRMDQLTVRNVAKIFNLMPDTVLLVSSEGTVALHGHFSECDEWNVEGSEERSKRSFGFARNALTDSSVQPSTSKWKPFSFPGRTGSSSQSVRVCVCVCAFSVILMGTLIVRVSHPVRCPSFHGRSRYWCVVLLKGVLSPLLSILSHGRLQ